MSDLFGKSEIAFYENVQRKSQQATKNLSHQEKINRDRSFNSSCGMSHFDGWMFNIAWDAARDYYLSPAGLMLTKKLFNSTSFAPEED